MLKKIIFSAIIFIATLEIGLRLAGTYYSSNEKDSGIYSKHYGKKLATWYHSWKPYDVYDYDNTEFHYINRYNELGHRETSFQDFAHDTASRKVVCTGDSFTEGDGAPYDSTWVRSLEQLSNRAFNRGIRFYNAGVCGSDVFFNSKTLTDKLMPANPACVIECLNTSDLNDVICMGGEERFNADGTTTGKINLYWEPLYKYSHLFRAIIHVIFRYDNNLVRRSTRDEQQQRAAVIVAGRVEKTAAYLAARKIAYYLVVHPCPHEIRSPDSVITYLERTFAGKPYLVNISDTMRAYYKVNDLEKNSYPINGHFNSKGYWVMGGMIFTRLESQLKKAL